MRRKDKGWIVGKAVRYMTPFLPRTPRIALTIYHDAVDTRDIVKGTVHMMKPETIRRDAEAIVGVVDKADTAVEAAKVVRVIHRWSRGRR